MQRPIESILTALAIQTPSEPIEPTTIVDPSPVQFRLGERGTEFAYSPRNTSANSPDSCIS